MECYLAGRKYHDADEVWNQLKVGTVFQLVRDLSNRYDVNAVALTFRAEDGEDYLIGYIPQTLFPKAMLLAVLRLKADI